MKRTLQILGEPDDRIPVAPVHLTIAGRVLSVADSHDGSAANRLASQLRAEGAADAGQSLEPDLRIVVRSTPQSLEARTRADVIEEAADVVLGSARASFARHLVRAYSLEAGRPPGPPSTGSASSP